MYLVRHMKGTASELGLSLQDLGNVDWESRQTKYSEILDLFAVWGRLDPIL